MGLISASIYTAVCFIILKVFEHPKNPLKNIEIFKDNKAYIILVSMFILLSMF